MPDVEKDVPEMFDADGYPTGEWLDYMRTLTGTTGHLVNLLTDAMRAYGGVRVEPMSDDFGRPIREVYMATGGWSGNEEIVGHLQRSFFWFAYWYQSRRGGGYWFRVPEDRWDRPMIDWPPAHETHPVPPVEKGQADG